MKTAAELTLWLESLPLEKIPHIICALAARLTAAGTPVAQAEVDQSLLDAKGMANRLCVPESWVRHEQRADRIPFLKCGRYVRFRVSDVEAAIAARVKE